MFCQMAIPLSYSILEMGWRGDSRETPPSFNTRRSWMLWDTQERKHLLCFSWKLLICHMAKGDRQREGRCWVHAWVAASLTFSNSRLSFSAEKEPARLRRKFAISEKHCKDRNENKEEKHSNCYLNDKQILRMELGVCGNFLHSQQMSANQGQGQVLCTFVEICRPDSKFMCRLGPKWAHLDLPNPRVYL